ncbi:hypothetical protein FB567DRAFT_612858 [Paraphoma chrysanthemicola]|uniref:Uncharacterized protein n=1 Tax=Paraphoma chrysanthemicola TaxID=798071 RepID=A0A8K0QVP8_9PLEO|nr:hypothetical protein FB567DRAFT_612858 [Paraphoma chrysanthemicola]
MRGRSFALMPLSKFRKMGVLETTVSSIYGWTLALVDVRLSKPKSCFTTCLSALPGQPTPSITELLAEMCTNEVLESYPGLRKNERLHTTGNSAIMYLNVSKMKAPKPINRKAAVKELTLDVNMRVVSYVTINSSFQRYEYGNDVSISLMSTTQKVAAMRKRETSRGAGATLTSMHVRGSAGDLVRGRGAPSSMSTNQQQIWMQNRDIDLFKGQHMVSRWSTLAQLIDPTGKSVSQHVIVMARQAKVYTCILQNALMIPERKVEANPFLQSEDSVVRGYRRVVKNLKEQARTVVALPEVVDGTRSSTSKTPTF